MRAAPLFHMQSDGPMDLVCMDFLSIEADSSNTENVLVITDHYTRYAQAFPTKDQKAATVAKVLLEKYLDVCIVIKVETLKVVLFTSC